MSTSKIPANQILKKLVQIQKFHQDAGGTEDDQLGRGLSQLVLEIAERPVHYAAGDLNLAKVQNLFDLQFDAVEFGKYYYGVYGKTKEDAWVCERNSQILSDHCFNKYLESLQDGVCFRGEGASRLIVDVFLIRARELLKQTIVDSSRPSSAVSPSQAPQETPSTQPISTFSAGSTPATMSLSKRSSWPTGEKTLLSKPFTTSPAAAPPPPLAPKPTTTIRSSPTACKLGLWIKYPLEFSLKKKGTDVSGRADYVFGYGDLGNPAALPPPETLLVVVEAKSNLRSVTDAIPQTLVYMAIIALHRENAGKSNQTIFGVCATGPEFLFLRLDNEKRVTRSRVYVTEEPEHREDILWFLSKVLMVAACSSPSSTPNNSPESAKRQMDRFKDATVTQRFDFGLKLGFIPWARTTTIL